MYDSNYGVKPGKIIAEIMQEKNITKEQLVKKCGLKLKDINRLLQGRKPITYEIAVKLSGALNRSAVLFMILEENYQIYKKSKKRYRLVKKLLDKNKAKLHCN